MRPEIGSTWCRGYCRKHWTGGRRTRSLARNQQTKFCAKGWPTSRGVVPSFLVVLKTRPEGQGGSFVPLNEERSAGLVKQFKWFEWWYLSAAYLCWWAWEQFKTVTAIFPGRPV